MSWQRKTPTIPGCARAAVSHFALSSAAWASALIGPYSVSKASPWLTYVIHSLAFRAGMNVKVALSNYLRNPRWKLTGRQDEDGRRIDVELEE